MRPPVALPPILCSSSTIAFCASQVREIWAPSTWPMILRLTIDLLLFKVKTLELQRKEE